MRTRDGASYDIRPIRPDDAGRERQFILGLSPESRHARMMMGMSEPSPELIAQFVELDYRQRMAFAAVVGEGEDSRFIGVARYAIGADALCEYAVAVLDAWQSRGVGAALTKLLFEYARAQGIKQLRCEILASNERMIEFARWLGMSVRRNPKDAGLVEGCYTL